MREINIVELKRLQLNILNDIAHFCESNHLRYYMAFGSLLGAIRHKGFIPWDDDVDIMMPRPDYEKFIRTYNTDTEKKITYLQLLHPGLDKNYYTTFSKVHDTRTRYQEKLCKETIYGVFVDVFPLDAFSNKIRYKIDLTLLQLASFKAKILHRKSGFSKNILKAITKILLLPFPASMLMNLANKLREGDFDNCDFVYSNAGIPKMIPRMLFDKCETCDFETLTVHIPSGYDKILKIWYGDYMKLPPEKERVHRHDALVWWKDDI